MNFDALNISVQTLNSANEPVKVLPKIKLPETGEEDVMSKLEPLIKLTFVIWSCDVKVTFSNFEILSKILYYIHRTW